MLQLKTYTLGPLDTNCYIIWDESAPDRPAVVIDPADAGDFLSEEILKEQVSLQAILLTHGHIDHMMGATELSLNFGVPVFVHPKDQFLIDRSVQTAKHWFGQDILPPPVTTPIEVAVPFTVGNYTIQILHTPGHTPGSVTFYLDTNDLYIQNEPVDSYTTLAFVGDVIFEHGYGRTDFSYAKPKQLWNSINDLQEKLPQKTLTLSGHGESFPWSGRL